MPKHATPPKHLVDPNSIRVGQDARFKCPEPGCSHGYWQVWLQGGLAYFGQRQCRLHGDKIVYMIIAEVREHVEPEPEPEADIDFTSLRTRHSDS